MGDLEKFQKLKKSVLLEYQKHYPYFQGNWKNFSSQDIINLIDLVQQILKENVSEKWIYTHLKKEDNEKLPRKDMLDIFSKFVGYSGWDEFSFEKIPEENKKRKNKFGLIGIVLLVVIFGFFTYLLIIQSNKNKIIDLKNQYTSEKIDENEVKAYEVNEKEKRPLPIENSQIRLEETENKNTKILIESPYYQKKTVWIDSEKNEEKTVVDLKPEDYAMMLKTFIKSDIKDWKTRKVQLDTILSDNLEVMVMLKNNLGAEYFNKKEFSEKLILPTASVKKMKVLEINKDNDNKIKFIRILQE